MVKKILLIILVFFIGIYFLLTSYFPEVEINKYDSVETAKEQQAIEKGWIPKNLPPSAYDIVETHDLDSNTILGKFSYKEVDETNFLAGLKEINGTYRREDFLFQVDKKLNLVNFRNLIKK
jgi:biopolymer transport protein ExbD